MSRRLGDDPLARARDARAKTAQASSLVVPGLTGDAPQANVLAASRAPYDNDVFFRRRGEAGEIAEGRADKAVTEISEISEIPEIREVAASQSNLPAQAPMAEESTSSDFVKTTEVDAPPKATTTEEVMAAHDAPVEEASHPAAAVAALAEEGQASLQAAEGQGPAKSGGFLKRFFGKFK